MLTSTLLILAASSLSLAAPTPKAGATAGKFSVAAVPNPKFKRNGQAALMKALLKYNLPLPAALNTTLHRRQDGSVAANPADQDVQYTCAVDIGGQTLNLDFDTGSADLWVFSTELDSSTSTGHNVFDSSKSSTWEAIDGATWEISYGDGSSASGDVGTDTVTVGGTVVQKQAVELASTVSDSFTQDTASDGLLGLAFSSINTVQPQSQLTFSENALSSLNSPVFTADLRHNAVGSYDFGYIDTAKYTGNIQYTPVSSSKGFWEFSAPKYKVGSGAFVSDGRATAIADTGTTLLLMSADIAAAYFAKVSGAKLSGGYYQFPCSATLPDLTVSVGQNTAVVPGSLINYAPVSEGSSTCFGGLQGSKGLKQYIYGDIFLKEYLAIFDLGSTRFGYAPKA